MRGGFAVKMRRPAVVAPSPAAEALPGAPVPTPQRTGDDECARRLGWWGEQLCTGRAG